MKESEDSSIKIPGGFYLTLDGPDGCGKSTQYGLLRDRLVRDGYDVKAEIREPGATSLGEKIREILLHDKNIQYSREVQMMLYETARRDIFDQKIIPALEQGKLVLCDRSFDSTTVYQGYAGGIPLETIDFFNKFAINNRFPDLSIILDVISAQDALSRISGKEPDKLESEPLEFHQKVVNGYREIAKENPLRCALIPFVENHPETVHNLIYKITNERINEKFGYT